MVLQTITNGSVWKLYLAVLAIMNGSLQTPPKYTCFIQRLISFNNPKILDTKYEIPS